MRRSVTVLDDLNKRLLTVRGQMMSALQVDIDYTTALNMFLEIGLRKYMESKLTPDECKIMVNYLNDQGLKDEARLDDLSEMLNKEMLRYVRNQAVHPR